MLLLSLILAHLLADFFLQTDKMAIQKAKSIKLHIVHHLLCTLIVITLFWGLQFNFQRPFQYLIFPLVLIVVSHYIIDLGKIYLQKKQRFNEVFGSFYSLYLFVFDQLCHLMVIILTCHWFYDLPLHTLFDKIKILFQTDTPLTFETSILFILMILMTATTVSGHIVIMVLGNLPNNLSAFEGKIIYKNDVNEDVTNHKSSNIKGLMEEYQFLVLNTPNYNRGKIIGYIERLLVILLTYYSAYPAIAFIITAKSITRFKQMDDRDFAEYFLLGTLLSMLLGISLGVLTRVVLR